MVRKDRKRLIRLSGIFVVFALTLSACALQLGGGAAGRAATQAARNPIPFTRITATPTTTLTPSPSPSPTPTIIPSPTSTATLPPTQPPVSRGPAIMPGASGELGSFLVDSRGMTLYIFKNDTVGVSNCGADCASIWPPLTIKAGLTPTGGPGVTGRLGVFKRAGGSVQVTYNGWPLYYFSGDAHPGDVNGQGIGGLWFAAPLAAVPPARPTLPPVYPTVVPGGGY